MNQGRATVASQDGNIGMGIGIGIGDGPGITALGLASARAVETSAPDRLIEDPYALGFVEAGGIALPMLTCRPEPGSPINAQQALHLHGSRYIGLRSRFYDDWLLDTAASGVRQAVVLGAGLDARAYRLDWPEGFSVFELDQAGVLGFKTTVMTARGAEPGCRHASVAADLRDDWTKPLLDAGFDPHVATAWLAEGLLAYLPAQAETQLFERIDRLSAAGSRLALDRILGDLGRDGGARLKQLSERSGMEMGKLVSTEGRTDALTWLADQGWDAQQQSVVALAEQYGRDLAAPFAEEGDEGGAEPPWLDTAFVTARRPL